MNESFLFPLDSSTEPMSVTWKTIQRLVPSRWTNRSPPNRIFGSMFSSSGNRVFGSIFCSSANWVFGSMIRSSARYESLDHYSRDLHRLRIGNRKYLFISFTFAWLGLVRREWYSFTRDNYRFCYKKKNLGHEKMNKANNKIKTEIDQRLKLMWNI